MNRISLLLLFALLLGQLVGNQYAIADPLSSWNEGPSKAAIIDFVERTTTEGSDFLPEVERVAVFDNDGTLWPENPLPFQLIFAIDELKRLAPSHPDWKENQLIQAAISGDMKTVLEGGKSALIELVSLTHAGITPEEFANRVRSWAEKTRHPRFRDYGYTKLGYQPMIEVLEYLRANGFKTYIVSGGGVDFMRVWAEAAYGIPPEQVIGSIGPASFRMVDGKPLLTKDPGVAFVDDKEGKPVAIHRQIGRRPVACFGNSDGDLQMMQWTTIGNKPSFGLIVHHTDAEREYAYDAHPKSSGKLVEALVEAEKHGWTVVDMKQDWKTVFSR